MREIIFAIMCALCLPAETGRMEKPKAMPVSVDFSVPALICVDGFAYYYLNDGNIVDMIENGKHVTCGE